MYVSPSHFASTPSLNADLDEDMEVEASPVISTNDDADGGVKGITYSLDALLNHMM